MSNACAANNFWHNRSKAKYELIWMRLRCLKIKDLVMKRVYSKSPAQMSPRNHVMYREGRRGGVYCDTLPTHNSCLNLTMEQCFHTSDSILKLETHQLKTDNPQQVCYNTLKIWRHPCAKDGEWRKGTHGSDLLVVLKVKDTPWVGSVLGSQVLQRLGKIPPSKHSQKTWWNKVPNVRHCIIEKALYASDCGY